MPDVPLVRHLADAEEYFFDEGCHIVELLNSEDEPTLSIARARVEPGQTTHWHRLSGILERYIVLEGDGVVELAGLRPESVRKGSVVVIPDGCDQRITNTGPTDLIFLAVCTPRFRRECYVDCEA